MSGYRRGIRYKKDKSRLISAHEVINWCSENFAAKQKYLKSHCKDSYLIILNDGDQHLTCSCRSCYYSIKIKKFYAENIKLVEHMASMMMRSEGKRLKELIVKND